jgi:hypothetical protein
VVLGVEGPAVTPRVSGRQERLVRVSLGQTELKAIPVNVEPVVGAEEPEATGLAHWGYLTPTPWLVPVVLETPATLGLVFLRLTLEGAVELLTAGVTRDQTLVGEESEELAV